MFPEWGRFYPDRVENFFAMICKYVVTNFLFSDRHLYLFLLFSLVIFTGTAHARAYTLDQAIETALANNPGLQADQMEEEASKAAFKDTKGRLLPQINVYGSYRRLSDPATVVPIKGFGGELPYFSRDQYSTGLRLSVSLFQGGRLRADVKAASSAMAASKAGTTRNRQVLIAQVTDIFNFIVYLKALVRAQTDTLEALEKTRNDAALRLQLGRVAPLDLMEMDTQVASQEQAIVSTRETLRRARQRLAVLMGLEPSAEPRVTGELTDSASSPPVSDSVEELLEKRPDVIQAQRQVEKAEAALERAKGLRLPGLELFGDYGRRAGSGFEGNEEVWSAGINLSLNIFSGGSISAKIAEAQARVMAARKRLKALRLETRSQVLSALSALKEAEARLVLSRKAQKSAEEAFRIEKLRYEKGAGTVTDLLKAQAAWQTAKAQLTQALYDKMAAITAIRLSTGTILSHEEDNPRKTLEHISWQSR